MAETTVLVTGYQVIYRPRFWVSEIFSFVTIQKLGSARLDVNKEPV